MQIAKHETMRSVNTAALLTCLIENGPMTRQELQKKTGLSWGAVFNIVAELLALKILCEEPLKSSHAGRKPSVLDFNTSDHLCAGIDVHMQGLTCLITDLRGRKLCSLRASISHAGREEVLALMKKLLHQAMEELKLTPEKLVGIGVSIQGSIDRASRVSLYSPHLPNWVNVPVCDVLESEFHRPAMLFHDTSAMLAAERRHGALSAPSMMFIKVDMGLGMAMMFNDMPYTGFDGNANEFGHMIINPDGPLCTCGNHGCLEAYVGGKSLLHQARMAQQQGLCKLNLPEEDGIEALTLLAEAAREGSPYEKQMFESMGRYFGIGLTNIINVINPELIVLGGDLARYSDLFLDSAMAVVHKCVWNSSRIQLTLSSLPSDGAAGGAAMSLLRQATSGGIPHTLGDLFRTAHAETEG